VKADALAGSLLLLATLWVAGSCLLPGEAAAERLAAGTFAVVGLAALVMLQGPLGADLLGQPLLVAGLALALLAALYGWRRPSLRPPRPDWITCGLVVACTAVVSIPSFRLPVDRLAPSHLDMEWHRGWIQQLLGGLPAPGGIYPHEPNGYPWLYHALVAGLTQALPGGTTVAFAIVQLFGVTAGSLGTWLCARRLGGSRHAARWSLVLFSAGAGVGWIWQHSPAGQIALHYDFGSHHDLGQYHGDLVLSNTLVPALGNISPLIPRELALCLTPVALWLVLRALDRPAPGRMIGAGFATGCVFMIGPVSAIFLAAWALLLALFERCREIWMAAVAAILTAAIWVLPLFINDRRYHGLVQITVRPSANPTTSQALVGLGVLSLLGLAGLALVAMGRTRLDRRRIAVLVGVPLVLILGAAIFASGSAVLGTPAILRWLRYLPYLVLALVIPGGCAAEQLVLRARAVARPLAAAAAIALVLVTTASTALAVAYVGGTPSPLVLRCTRPLQLTPDDRFAVIGRALPGDSVAEAVFAATGASALWVSDDHVKVRFRTWLETIPSQRARKALIRAYVQGGPPPPGVQWLFIPGGLDVDRSSLTKTGRCVYGGEPYGVFRVN
jgi:hypothetical protein